MEDEGGKMGFIYLTVGENNGENVEKIWEIYGENMEKISNKTVLKDIILRVG